MNDVVQSKKGKETFCLKKQHNWVRRCMFSVDPNLMYSHSMVLLLVRPNVKDRQKTVVKKVTFGGELNSRLFV